MPVVHIRVRALMNEAQITTKKIQVGHVSHARPNVNSVMVPQIPNVLIAKNLTTYSLHLLLIHVQLLVQMVIIKTSLLGNVNNVLRIVPYAMAQLKMNVKNAQLDIIYSLPLKYANKTTAPPLTSKIQL